MWTKREKNEEKRKIKRGSKTARGQTFTMNRFDGKWFSMEFGIEYNRKYSKHKYLNIANSVVHSIWAVIIELKNKLHSMNVFITFNYLIFVRLVNIHYWDLPLAWKRGACTCTVYILYSTFRKSWKQPYWRSILIIANKTVCFFFIYSQLSVFTSFGRARFNCTIYVNFACSVAFEAIIITEKSVDIRQIKRHSIDFVNSLSGHGSTTTTAKQIQINCLVLV